MKTIYFNMRTNYGIETVDEFTQGENAPQNWREFRKYINEMLRNYIQSGMYVYTSQRSTKEWREK